jgi:hypothetical protein
MNKRKDIPYKTTVIALESQLPNQLFCCTFYGELYSVCLFTMPSFFIFDANVEGGRFSNSAAPPGPDIL